MPDSNESSTRPISTHFNTVLQVDSEDDFNTTNTQREQHLAGKQASIAVLDNLARHKHCREELAKALEIEHTRF